MYIYVHPSNECIQYGYFRLETHSNHLSKDSARSNAESNANKTQIEEHPYHYCPLVQHILCTDFALCCASQRAMESTPSPANTTGPPQSETPRPSPNETTLVPVTSTPTPTSLNTPEPKPSETPSPSPTETTPAPVLSTPAPEPPTQAPEPPPTPTPIPPPPPGTSETQTPLGSSRVESASSSSFYVSESGTVHPTEQSPPDFSFEPARSNNTLASEFSYDDSKYLYLGTFLGFVALTVVILAAIVWRRRKLNRLEKDSLFGTDSRQSMSPEIWPKHSYENSFFLVPPLASSSSSNSSISSPLSQHNDSVHVFQANGASTYSPMYVNHFPMLENSNILDTCSEAESSVVSDMFMNDSDSEQWQIPRYIR
jgi:hypothetical protein